MLLLSCRDFPEEMEETMSSLIFAASRTGELPELQEIRRMLISKYGKDFAYSAVELRKNCRVHPKASFNNFFESFFSCLKSPEFKLTRINHGFASDGAEIINGEIEFGSQTISARANRERQWDRSADGARGA